jgi:hypothetical protein
MVDFDPAKLATVPHLTALPMTVIAIWGTIDGILAKMISHLMKSDLETAVAMFHALQSQERGQDHRTASRKERQSGRGSM